MKEKLRIYIDSNLEVNKKKLGIGNVFKYAKAIFSDYFEEECCDYDLDEYIDSNINDNMFQTLLFRYIDERNLKDCDVYNKVHIDRRLFSKIRSNSNYHPSKETIILLGLSLELNEEEIVLLLESASYSLPKNNYYDLIIRFCFSEGIYEIKDVNELLASYDCKLFYY